MHGPRSNRAGKVQSTPEKSLRRAERKLAKVSEQTHGGYAGPSLIEILEGKLLGACVQYLAFKDNPDTISGPFGLMGWRGIIRGMAEGVATMRNPYVADRRQIIKAIEREFMKKARTTMSIKE